MNKLPLRVYEICWEMYDLNKELAHGNDNQRRKLTKMIAEQVCFELGVNWGTKASKPHYPQSKDAIAFKLPNGNIDIWDWQNGNTRKPQIKTGDEPDYSNTKQYFIKVNPVDHLGDNPIPIPEPPPVPIPNPNPNPNPNPCKPKYPHTVQIPLAREIGLILDAPNSPYIDNLEGACEFVGYILYHVQFLKMTPDEARAEARRRAQGIGI